MSRLWATLVEPVVADDQQGITQFKRNAEFNRIPLVRRIYPQLISDQERTAPDRLPYDPREGF